MDHLNSTQQFLKKLDGQIDSTASVVFRLFIVIYFVIAAILSVGFAVILVAVGCFALGLKLALRVVVSRPIVSQAFALAGVC